MPVSGCPTALKQPPVQPPVLQSRQEQHLQYLRVAGRVMGERPAPAAHDEMHGLLVCCAAFPSAAAAPPRPMSAGLALLHGVPLGFHLSSALYKGLLGEEDAVACGRDAAPGLEDLKEIDPQVWLWKMEQALPMRLQAAGCLGLFLPPLKPAPAPACRRQMWASFRAVLEAEHVSGMVLTWTLSLDNLGVLQEVPLCGERNVQLHSPL